MFRIGMKPELVLSEDDKKRRFKKFLQKKETESQMRRSDEDDLSVTPPLPPLEQTPRYSNFMSDVFQNNLRILFTKRRMEQDHKPDILDLRTDFDNNRTHFPMKTPVNPFSIYPNDHLKIKLEEEEFIKPCVSPAKDYEALKYFTNRGMYQPESASLTSPDKTRVFSVNPMHQAQLFAMPRSSIFSNENSLKFNTERKSVITFPPNFKFKTEHIFGGDEFTKEENDEEPRDLSLKRDSTDSCDDEDGYKYVHKKFRTQEKSEDDGIIENNQCRQSVITHANKITM